jgi:hypothetical protein
MEDHCPDGGHFSWVRLWNRGCMAWRLVAQVALAADSASIGIMRTAFELQAVVTPAVQESGVVASSDVSSRRTDVSEIDPSLARLVPQALATRYRAELVTERFPE